jgi:hypothetical protein
MIASLFLRTRSGGPPLRIGLLLDSPELSACFSEVVDHIERCNFAHLELLVFNAEDRRNVAESSQKPPLLRRLVNLLFDRRGRHTFLYGVYQRWDRRHQSTSHDPLAPVDCSARLAPIESISVMPIRTRFVHRFAANDIERIRAKRLDVLIRFGFNILRGDILSAARYGVWSYHHGDGDYYRGGPAYFWEVLEGNPLSGAMLQILTEELDAGKILCKGYYPTQPGLSRARNCDQPYWGASSFVIQKLHELHEYGWQQVEREILKQEPYLGRKKIYTVPTNSEMLRWLVPALARKTLGRLTRRRIAKHWRLAIRTTTQLLGESGSVPNVSDFRWLESPAGHYYADPFLIEERGQTWVFFEDFSYQNQLGRICCAKICNGELGDIEPVLEKSYHLSYPCLFRAEDELFMIPESGANGTIELYRCVRFPDQWALERVLLSAKAVDTTVCMKDNRYWFFTTLQEPRGMGAQLWLFSSSSLTGTWTPHPENPISTDTRTSRGGGAIFQRDGKLYRPSQDCSKHYGYSFTLNEIEALDRNHYKERPVVSVDPVWAPNLVGTHTYSQAGNVEIIDGCSLIPQRRVAGPRALHAGQHR